MILAGMPRARPYKQLMLSRQQCHRLLVTSFVPPKLVGISENLVLAHAVVGSLAAERAFHLPLHAVRLAHDGDGELEDNPLHHALILLGVGVYLDALDVLPEYLLPLLLAVACPLAEHAACLLYGVEQRRLPANHVLELGVDAPDVFLHAAQVLIGGVQPVLHVAVLAVVHVIQRVQSVHLLRNLPDSGIRLPSGDFQPLQLRFQLGRVNLSIHALPDLLRELAVIHGLREGFQHLRINAPLRVLPPEVATLSVHELPVLASIVERVGVMLARPVLFLLAVDVAIKTRTAHGALQDSRQEMGMVQAVTLLVAHARLCPHLMDSHPRRLVDDCLVTPVMQLVVVLLHHVVLVAGSLDLLRPASAVGNLAHVDRVVQNALDEVRAECRVLAVLVRHLAVATVREPVGDARHAQTVQIHPVNHPDVLGGLRDDFQLAVLKHVAIRRLTAVPPALTGLLPPACHRLVQYVLALNLGHRCKNGDDQLSRILGRVDAVLDANQVHAMVLHPL